MEYSDYDDIENIEYSRPIQERGYNLFPEEMENDPLVFFHLTAAENIDPILKDGFKPNPELTVNYFAHSSSRTFAYKPFHNGKQVVILAVRFERLDSQYSKVNDYGDLMLKPELQPTVIAVCYVPQ